MSEESSPRSERILRDVDLRNGYTEFNHLDCGKKWEQAPDDEPPNYCPGCGDEL